jgi:flagella basal body P-ring formation protein FlgA
METVIILAALAALHAPAGLGSRVSWPPEPDEIRSTIETLVRQRAGMGAAVTVSLLDYSRRPVTGDLLEFGPTGISKVGTDEYIWRGRVVMKSENRSLPVWARVRINLHGPVWIAERDIPPGTQLTSGDCQKEQRPLSIIGLPPFAADQTPTGRITRTRIPAGATIAAGMLWSAPVLRRGDRVVVRVDRGQTHLEFEAIATADATTGRTVLLRNPGSGRRFQGLIDESGRVTVPAPRAGER